MTITPEREREIEHPLIREYRPSMDRDTLHDWAKDAVAKMRSDASSYKERGEELELALKALEPFAEAARVLADADEAVRQCSDETAIEAALWESQQPVVGDLRRALAVLAQSKEPGV